MLMRRIIHVAALALFAAAPLHAGEVMLTVAGDVAPGPDGGDWTFDNDALHALPVTSFTTSTIWTDGPQSFEGVLLKTLLDRVGAAEGTIKAVALNDYMVEIPTEDAVDGGPIIAYMRNGHEIGVRDKGPLWLVYPFDDDRAYQSEEYYSRSIWQLNRLTIVDGK